MNKLKENYITLLDEQKYLIEHVPVFTHLYKMVNVIPGYGDRYFRILESGDNGVASLLDRLEAMEDTVKNIPINVKQLLINLTINQNLRCGFSIAEYNDLVKYFVITTWKSLNGQIGSESIRFSDEKPNSSQQQIIDYIYQYPFLLTLLVIENQVIIITKDNKSSKQ